MQEWADIASDTENVTSLKLPRSYIQMESSKTYEILHIFTNASIEAYSICTYITTHDQSSLFTANKMTLPKLEHIGA